MTPTWGRRARGPFTVLLALAVTPLLTTGSAPTATVAQDLPGTASEAAPAAVIDPFEESLTFRTTSQAALGALPRPSRAVAAGGAGAREGGAISPKGRLWTVSALSDHGLPTAAKQAYQRAAAAMARTDPSCGLTWTLLAGIGRVESDHGRYDGARLGADGVSRPKIIGLQLNGRGPVAAIRDTDDGRLDGDRVWDRAVGPMQFIPGTWESAARDGDGDGRKNPHDLDDAAAAAAAYLCSGYGNLQYGPSQAAAIYRYNQDDYYVALVQAFETGYRTGVFVMPPPPPTEEELAEERRRRRAARLAKLREERRERRLAAAAEKKAQSSTEPEVTTAPKPSQSPTSSPKPAPKPAPKPSPKPSPTPSPTPSETAEPEPEPYEKSGKLATCDGGYCLAGALLDLGPLGNADGGAAGDFDVDGTAETNGQELDGLLAADTVTMVVVKLDSGRLGIFSINGTSVT